ncbi:hypothetical protein EMCRGX_G023174 [Ephydatia muelleri]
MKATTTKNNSFRIKRIGGNIVVCDVCGQGHEPGKNHLYDYPDNVDETLLCSLCVQALANPVDSPCGHTFCGTCLAEYLRTRRALCPIDGKTLREKDVKPSSVLVCRLLDRLNVVCPNNAYCDQVMARSELEAHLRLHCAGAYTSCPREEAGCSYVGPRSQLEEHLWNCTYGSDVDKKTGLPLPIVPGQQSTVEVPKGSSELGMTVSWNEETSCIVVDEVFPEGNVGRDGRLCPGDQILSVNRMDCTQVPLAQVNLALSAPNIVTTITVFREIRDECNTEVTELERTEGRPLGIQIRSFRRRPGVYVKHLVPGSKAEECARLHVGDRLLEANGFDLRHSNVDDAASFISQIVGPLRLKVEHNRCASWSNQSSQSNSSPNSSLSRKGPIYDEIKTTMTSGGGPKAGASKCIMLKKQHDETFGMNVAGGVGCLCGDLPVFVSDIRPDSVVQRCGRVQKGDVILSINGVSLLGKSHAEAIQVIKSAVPLSVVRIELIQGEETVENGGLSPDWCKWLAKYESGHSSPQEYTITIVREGKESLGFSIVGGANSSKGDSPVYIRSVAPSSITEEDGRLRPGDEILSINGIPVEAEKRGVKEGNGGEGAAAEGPRRSPRGGGAIVSYVTPKYSPGDAALKAAYEYLEGRFESPGLAAQHWLVERQHVNYYVRKLAAQGLVSSKMSTSRASIEPMMPISQDEPDGGVAEEVSAHETWCAAWRFAAELVHVLGM